MDARSVRLIVKAHFWHVCPPGASRSLGHLPVPFALGAGVPGPPRWSTP